jgi:hypothetical protein
MYERDLESQGQIADRCAPWIIANGAENFVLQALQFYKMDICRKFPGGTNMSFYRSNESFVEDQFNVSA